MSGKYPRERERGRPLEIVVVSSAIFSILNLCSLDRNALEATSGAERRNRKRRKE